MAKVATSERVLAERLLTASTLTDIDAIMQVAERAYGSLTLRPVGDRPNNIGPIRLGSDPPLGIVERVTNGIDDLLDLGRAEHPDQTPSTPREAAHLWLG